MSGAILATVIVQFTASRADVNLIERIARRAIEQGFSHGRSREDVEMDIEAVHCNGTPLRLAELIAADDLNFAHDVVGIGSHIDRSSGTLGNHFLPRFAAPPKVK